LKFIQAQTQSIMQIESIYRDSKQRGLHPSTLKHIRLCSWNLFKPVTHSTRLKCVNVVMSSQIRHFPR